jgi:F-type H+-transporting ATPase subunit delta
MPSGAVARRYAKALFQLAREQDAVEQVMGELESLSATLGESPELRDVLLRPLHPAAERRKVLEALSDKLQCGALVRRFASFLIDRRRLVDFGAIRGEFRRLADEAAGIVHAQVRSASPLDEQQRARLASVLSGRVGANVALEVQVDESLIGGLVAQVGDLVFDGSLRTQLRQIRSGLSEA